jgi:hypothetical protein
LVLQLIYILFFSPGPLRYDTRNSAVISIRPQWDLSCWTRSGVALERIPRGEKAQVHPL